MNAVYSNTPYLGLLIIITSVFVVFRGEFFTYESGDLSCPTVRLLYHLIRMQCHNVRDLTY